MNSATVETNAKVAVLAQVLAELVARETADNCSKDI